LSSAFNGLAHARRADHDDVLGHDVVREVRRELLAAHAVAQGDGDGTLGGMLAYDILVQLDDDLAGGEFVECEGLVFSRSG
jgi:hypothetical protein